MNGAKLQLLITFCQITNYNYSNSITLPNYKLLSKKLVYKVVLILPVKVVVRFFYSDCYPVIEQSKLYGPYLHHGVWLFQFLVNWLIVERKLI